MRYTEKEYDYEYHNFKEWLQGIAALFIVAPLRLFNEISTKLIYLQRSLVLKVLNLTVFLQVLYVTANIGFNLWLGELNIWAGKIPIVLQCASLVLLTIINIWYRFYDFAIYQQLEKLLPNKDDTISERATIAESKNLDSFSEVRNEPETSSFTDFESSILTELDELPIEEVVPQNIHPDIGNIANFLANETLTVIEPKKDSSSNDEVQEEKKYIDLSGIDDTLLDILNEDLLEDEDTIAYQSELNTEVFNMEALTDDDLSTEMDKSTEPSKYIPEDQLFSFISNMYKDDFSTLDTFGDWKVPDDFNLLD